MANGGWDDLVVMFDDSAGTPVNITAYIDVESAMDISAKLQDWKPKGSIWPAPKDSGAREIAPITLEGLYDDTATTGPDVLFWNAGAALGSTRTYKETWISTPKSTQVEVVIEKYVRTPQPDGLTRFAVTLRPTGAPTEV